MFQVVFALELFWPILVLSVIVLIKNWSASPNFSGNNAGNSQICIFPRRTLPSADLFSFFQTFLCNVDNKCVNDSIVHSNATR